MASGKPVGAWAGSQRLIPTGERSGLSTRITATKNVSLGERIKLASFLEVQSVIREVRRLNDKDNNYRFSYLR
jgi:hypothetical protein